jgi:hypothetical protein
MKKKTDREKLMDFLDWYMDFAPWKQGNFINLAHCVDEYLEVKRIKKARTQQA